MFLSFAKSEAGAVTVDWVVLTAALVGLGMATMAVVSGGVGDVSGDVDTQLTDQEISTSFDEALAGLSLTADTLTSWHHNEAWYDAVTAAYSDPADWTPAELTAQHQAMADIILAANPGDIASGHYHNAIDHMGALEIGMAAQGIAVPDSGINYETARTNYLAGNA